MPSRCGRCSEVQPGLRSQDEVRLIEALTGDGDGKNNSKDNSLNFRNMSLVREMCRVSYRFLKIAAALLVLIKILITCILRIISELFPQFHKLVVTNFREPPHSRDVLAAADSKSAAELYGGRISQRFARHDLHGRMDTMVDKALRLCILHTNVLDFQRIRLFFKPAAAERVQRQAEEIVLVQEQHNHHASLGVRGALAGDGETVIFRIDVWVRICNVERSCDHLAEFKVTACVI